MSRDDHATQLIEPWPKKRQNIITAGNGETRGLITPPPRWVSTQLLYVCVNAW